MTQQDISINFNSSSLAAATRANVALEDNDTTDANGQGTRDLVPFKNINFINSGTTLLRVRINSQVGYKPVPAGTILQLDDLTISRIEIENVDLANAGAYDLELNSTDTQNSLLKKLLAKRLI